jgi:lipopolysaccharide/colanic/teichoic acid biosynthesis glycosyltransferase
LFKSSEGDLLMRGVAHATASGREFSTPAEGPIDQLHVQTRRSTWSRIRLQFGIGTVFAVLIPWAAHVAIWGDRLEADALRQSLVGTVIALVLGYYSFRRFSNYPGARSSRSIIPSFLASYGAVLATFFFARLEYNRIQFALSFVLCVLWFFIVYFKLQRQKDLRIGVVPAGRVDTLLHIPGVDWVQLGEVHTSRRFDTIVADLRADMPAKWERFLADCALSGVQVMHVRQVEESLTGKVAIEHLSENTLGTLLPNVVYSKVKSLGDVLVAIASLPFVGFIMLIAAIAIRIDSPGLILFRQSRMGYRGRTFTMYKLRTMRMQEPDLADPRVAAITRGEDDRVTRVGRFLRRYRIDELPQIINIIRGEMSWIGPRPEAVPLSSWYEAELPFYRYRHIVRPGITGWAQVRQGHVADVKEVLSKLHYDFYYIKHFSFWLDLLILAGTVRTIFTGFGAR